MANNRRIITGGPDVLDQAAKKVSAVANDFFNAYSNMYIVAQNDLSNVWKGPDYDAFSAQLESHENKYRTIYNILNEYSNLLRQTAAAYEDQINIISSTSRQITID